MDIKEIQNLIKFVAKSGASEVKLEMDDIKITIKTGGEERDTTTFVQQIPMSAPVAQTVAPAASAPTTAAPASATSEDKAMCFVLLKQ